MTTADLDKQLDLAQTLWDHAAPPMDSTISGELRELLETWLWEAELHPETCIPWDEALSGLRW